MHMITKLNIMFVLTENRCTMIRVTILILYNNLILKLLFPTFENNFLHIRDFKKCI